jgi:hypothetical protein
MSIFPGDDCGTKEVTECLLELNAVGLLSSYVVAGEEFIHINGWHHQTIQRPTRRYPASPFDSGCSMSPPGALPDDSIPSEAKRKEAKRKEAKGKEVNSARALTHAREVEFSQDQVADRCRDANQKIMNVWGCGKLGPKFQAKLRAGATAVEGGVLPPAWLDGALADMLASKRRSPAGWIGKVLAARAADDHGVDFDAFQRALHEPED